MNQDKEIVAEERGSLGIITLNRPKALNALSYPMIQALRGVLDNWRSDPKIKMIFIRGQGERAFCAGGDIKMAYHAGLAFKQDPSARSPTDFFGDEYRLNKVLFHYPKPVIAYMDGITMGGGYGIGGNCKYRVVSERTVFAMPEVGIGFFPDVGSAYHLARATGRSGFYLALTGAQVSGVDMLYAGLAEYFVPSDKENGLIAALETGDAEVVLKMFYVLPYEKGFLEAHAQEINSVFASDDPEQILKDFGGSHLCEIVPKRSPTSVKLAARHVSEAAHRSFDESIEQDYTLARHCMAGHDIYEGIRATLIDKDKNPHWSPDRLSEVSDEMLESHFVSDGTVLGQ